MKRPFRHMVFLLLLGCLLCETLHAGEKSRYDFSGLVRAKPGAASATLSALTPGWKIRQTYAEATVMPGGYYTLGTAEGLSGTRLDSATTITYGHPFARTSYPIIHIDGVWGKPEDLLPGGPTSVQVAAESVAVSYLTSQQLRVTFSLRLSDEGRRVTLTARIANEGSAAHNLGCGFALDPSLGNRGDGVFSIDAFQIHRDTVISGSGLLSGSLRVTERSTNRKGMKIGFQFPTGPPATCLVANWRDLLASDTTNPSLPPMRTIYDLMLKMFWSPELVQGGAAISHTLEVDVLAPDFGSDIFMRWDLPGFISLDDGVLFPRVFTSWAVLNNLSSLDITDASVQLVPTSPVESSVQSRSTNIGAHGFQYVWFPLAVKEVYEDQVASMMVVCSKGGVAVDTLVRPFFVPATPVSDTGLTVTIDSVITSSFPEVSLVFEAQRSATLQKLYNIIPANVFLYDNGTRISSMTLGKDLGDGAGQVDIVFVLDVTGSMGEEITAVKNNIVEFADSLVVRGIDFRLGMVTFLDAIENVYDFTTNAQQFKNAVGLQFAHGGGDTPENSLDALYRATLMQFRESANKVFVWITDADFHEQDWATTRTRQEVLDQLLLMDVTVNAIGDPQYQTDFYNTIVDPTGGQFYDINGNFRDILLDIGRLQGVSRYRLTYQSPAAGPGERQVTLTLHTAGLGGTATTLYTVPGGNGATVLSCYPNPFNPFLTIRFNTAEAERATLTLFDILGRRVRQYTLQGGSREAEVVWDARNDTGQEVGTGIYFVRLSLFGPGNRVLGSSLAKVLHLK